MYIPLTLKIALSWSNYHLLQLGCIYLALISSDKV